MKVSLLKKFAFPLLLTSLIVVVTGCGGGYKGPELGKCSGTVTYDGKPVEGATVTMTNSGGIASGLTDAAGKFSMVTPLGGQGWPGVPLGTLKVTISKMETDPIMTELGPMPETTDIEASNAYETKRQELMKKYGDSPPKPKSLIPAKYGSLETSGLTVEMTKEGKENIEFNLTD